MKGLGEGLTTAHRPAAAVAVAVLLAICASSARAVTPQQIVDVINRERAANGLPQVVQDATLSAGNAAHDNYARQNGSPSTGYTFRSEDPSKPGYTAAGAQAAGHSIFGSGTRSSADVFNNDDWAFGDIFDNAPDHLLQLMDPGVATVGADQLDFSRPPFGTVHVSSIDIRSAPARPAPKQVQAYAYIGPDGRAPASVTYFEGPTAGTVSGPWLYVYFLVPAGAKVDLRSLALQRLDGTVVPARSFTTGVQGARQVAAKAPPRQLTAGGILPLMWPTRLLGPPDLAKGAEKNSKLEIAKNNYRDALLNCWHAGIQAAGGGFGTYIAFVGGTFSQAACNADAERAYNDAEEQIDPPDPNFGAVAFPVAAPSPQVRCPRKPKRARQSCPRLRKLAGSVLRVQTSEVSIERARVTTLNRLSTALSAGDTARANLQVAVIQTLDGQLAGAMRSERRAGRRLVARLRRFGARGRVSSARLAAVGKRLLSGDARRFPAGLAAALTRDGITPSHFSDVLRQAFRGTKLRTVDAFSGLAPSTSTAGIDRLHSRLSPSQVGAIVASLAASGAITAVERDKIQADVSASRAATTFAARQAATRSFEAHVAPLRPDVRAFLAPAASGLMAADGYRLVADYVLNGKRRELVFPVPVSGG